MAAPKLTDLEFYINNFLGVLARLIGITVFVILIVGGYQYLTAAGDPKKADQAQQTITGAIVGIVIIIAGWFALNILEQVTGANLTSFSICINPPCN